MALTYAQGAIQWNSADTLGTTKTVNLPAGFLLRALEFTTNGQGSAVDAGTEALDSQRCVGFATSASLRRAVSSFDDDNATTMLTASILRDDCIAVTLSSTAAVTGLLDITTFSDEQFILTVDDVVPANITVFWRAWGGSDITVATVIDIAEPAATGVQTYSVTGFTSGATDQVVMLAGVRSTAAANTGTDGDAGFFVGWATGTAGTNNVCVAGYAADAGADALTRGAGRAGQCIIQAGSTVTARAALTQWNTDNFGLNWSEVGITGRRTIALCLKGGQWAAGGYTIAGNTLNATTTVSGLPFQPVGINLVGAMKTEAADDAVTTQDRISWGGGTSTTDRHAMGHWSEAATTASNVNLQIQYDQALVFPSGTGTEAASYDIGAINSDGFQIIVDVAGGVASEWQGYLAFGSAASGAQTLTPSLFTNAATFFAATVTAGVVSLTPALYTDADTFYAPTVSGTYTLSPGLYTDSDTFYSPTVSTSYSITPGLYTDPDTFYSPAVSATYTLTPGLYDDGDTFYSATVSQSEQFLQPSLYVDDDTFYSATVTGGDIATPVTESAGGGRFYYLPPENKKKKRAVEKEVEAVRDVELVSKAEQFPREIADQIEQAVAKMREISRIDAEIMILMERDLFEEEALLLLMAA